jgi:thiamine biosynthesis lipoprotein
MGTLLEITYPPEADIKTVIKTITDSEKEIKNFENAYNGAPEGSSFGVDGLWTEVFRTAFGYQSLSGGRFDIRALTLTSLYGFPEGPYAVPDNETLKKAMEVVASKPILFMNGKLVKENAMLKISTGAFTKGMIVDKAVKKMKESGAASGIVNAGGDLYALGKKGKAKWRVGIRHPDNPNDVISAVSISDKAVATSGDYERFFEQNGVRYHHIFDMKTGKSADIYRSVSVIADTCEEADGLATVFFLIPETEAAELCKRTGTPVLLYTKDNRTLRLCGWGSFES